MENNMQIYQSEKFGEIRTLLAVRKFYESEENRKKF